MDSEHVRKKTTEKWRGMVGPRKMGMLSDVQKMQLKRNYSVINFNVTHRKKKTKERVVWKVGGGLHLDCSRQFSNQC